MGSADCGIYALSLLYLGGPFAACFRAWMPRKAAHERDQSETHTRTHKHHIREAHHGPFGSPKAPSVPVICTNAGDRGRLWCHFTAFLALMAMQLMSSFEHLSIASRVSFKKIHVCFCMRLPVLDRQHYGTCDNAKRTFNCVCTV